jgi:hypothetical protein
MHSTSVSLLECLREPASDDAWARFVRIYTPLLGLDADTWRERQQRLRQQGIAVPP